MTLTILNSVTSDGVPMTTNLNGQHFVEPINTWHLKC